MIEYMKNIKNIWMRTAITILAIIAVIYFIIFIAEAISGARLSVLDSARERSADKAVIASLAVLNPISLLYKDSRRSYLGFCHDAQTLEYLQSASMTVTYGKDNSNYACNENVNNWAASVPLASGGYSCIDVSHTDPLNTNSQLSKNTSCPQAE
jgi:hypothetical protein